MKEYKVESSQIESLSYNESFLFLDVKFRTGAIYRYSNIDGDLLEDFLRADSVGRFFAQNIKSKPEEFPFKKIQASTSELEKHADSIDVCSYCKNKNLNHDLMICKIVKNGETQTIKACSNYCASFAQMSAEG